MLLKHSSTSLGVDVFSLLLGKYLGVDLMGQKADGCLAKNCQTAFQSGCIIRHPPRNAIVPVALCPRHYFIRILYKKTTFVLAYTVKRHMNFYLRAYICICIACV